MKADRLCSRLPRPGGFTITELIVAASLLVVVLSVATSLTVRSGRLWQDTRYYRLAIEELTNHLERLTALEEGELAEAIAQLSPSSQIRAALPNPALSAESFSDAFGQRLVLALSWDRLGQKMPVTLVGWIDPLPTSAEAVRSPAARRLDPRRNRYLSGGTQVAYGGKISLSAQRVSREGTP